MRRIAIPLLLAVFAGIGRTDDPAAQKLPAELVAAWEKAGARVGWMADDQFGCPRPREGAEGKKGEVPAFRFWKWKAGVMAQLPQPQTAFGLYLTETQVTDAGLKELSGLKSLQSLDLAARR